MNINDIEIGQEVFVLRSSPVPEKGCVTRIVYQGDMRYVIVCVNGREYRCRSNWLTTEKPSVSDEQFEQWWNFEGGNTENLFHWYAQNYHLVSLEGVTNSDALALSIKEAMYKQATGRKYEHKNETL